MRRWGNRRSGRRQHLPGIDAAARTGDAEAAVGTAVQPGDCGVLVDLRTRPDSGLRQAHAELADVHLRAGLLQQTAMETGRTHFRADAGGQLQLADTREVAGDVFLPDDAFDLIDRRIVSW